NGTAGRGSGQGGSPAAGAGFAPAAATLRRLTAEQYVNTVRALLGDGVTLSVTPEPDTVLSGFVDLAAARATISPTAKEKYEEAAYELAAYALAAERREAFVGCAPAGVVDDDCTRAFLERFGRRVFRRPLTEAELTRYTGLARTAATTLNDFYGGIEFAV